MTNRDDLPETVAVPVELLKELIEIVSFHKGSTPAGRQANALLPKPKPRLVAVSGDQFEFNARGWFDLQPDLLTLLDEAVDEVMNVADWPRVRDGLKARIRTALGVTE